MTLRSSLSRHLRSDQGIALPMVLLVFFLSVALVTAFLIAIVGSSSVTGANKSLVEAQAAAEAGVAEQTALMQNGDPCTLAGSFNGSSGAAQYSGTVSCTDDAVIITSTGIAEAGTSQTVETTFALTKSVSGTPASLRALTIMQLSSGWPSINLIPGNPDTQLNIAVSNGDWRCWQNRVIDGDLTVANGKLALGSGCTVTGDVMSAKSVEINGNSSVHGNVYARDDVKLYNKSVVEGNISSTDGVVVVNDSYVEGNVIAGAKSGRSEVGPEPSGKPHRVAGTFVTGGNSVHTWGAAENVLIGGGIIRDPGVQADFDIPSTPWVESSFDADTWVRAGYTVVPGGSCEGSAMRDRVAAASVPTVFTCADDLNWHQEDLVFRPKTDIAVVSPGGWTNAVRVESGDGAEHTFSFITPDTNLSDSRATCHSKNATMDLTGIQIIEPLLATVYTPCQLNLGGGTIRGNVHVGSLHVWGDPSLIAFETRVPGLDTSGDDGAGPGPDAKTQTLGDLLSHRNVN